MGTNLNDLKIAEKQLLTVQSVILKLGSISKELSIASFIETFLKKKSISPIFQSQLKHISSLLELFSELLDINSLEKIPLNYRKSLNNVNIFHYNFFLTFISEFKKFINRKITFSLYL